MVGPKGRVLPLPIAPESSKGRMPPAPTFRLPLSLSLPGLKLTWPYWGGGGVGVGVPCAAGACWAVGAGAGAGAAAGPGAGVP